jgi:hypothetical protein
MICKIASWHKNINGRKSLRPEEILSRFALTKTSANVITGGLFARVLENFFGAIVFH